MAQVLNGMLYEMLRCTFQNQVRIRNQGEKMIAHYRKYHGEMILDVEHPGEYYVVCCPFCGDTRFRLNINHRWGKPDEQGRTNLWLAICFNEQCLVSGNHERRVELLDMVTDHEGDRLAEATIQPGEEINLDDLVADWPGPSTRVDRLPPEHKAYQYLLNRGFPPERVGPFWNVRYCHQSVHYLARDRIVVPIYSGKVMKGWQCRYIGEIPKGQKWPPKYYTCPAMPRHMLLYNLANARQYRTGVIVEGVTDVWSGGPPFMCTLGATMNVQQRKLFVRAFKDQAGVLCFDPEEFEKETVQRLVRDIRKVQFKRGFACVKLPEGSDPGSLDRRLLREYIYREAKKEGVRVSWKKRS